MSYMWSKRPWHLSIAFQQSAFCWFTDIWSELRATIGSRYKFMENSALTNLINFENILSNFILSAVSRRLHLLAVQCASSQAWQLLWFNRTISILWCGEDTIAVHWIGVVRIGGGQFRYVRNSSSYYYCILGIRSAWANKVARQLI